MKIEVLLRRSEGKLEQILDKPVYDVLSILDQDAIRTDYLVTLITESMSVQTLLSNTSLRNIIIRSMKKNEAITFAKVIGIKEWNDIHYKLTHTKFTNKIMKKALDFFEAKFEDKTIDKKPDIETIDSKRILFQHQIDTIKKIREKLSDSPYKALLHMPTGSGKTKSAMNIVLTQLLENPKALVIWLAHNEELCEQAINEFQDMWRDAGDRKIHTYRFFRKSAIDLRIVSEGFVSASLQKMLAAAGNNNTFLSEVAQNANLVIIDEAHQAIADKFSVVIEEISRYEKTKLLGLSATPGRTSDAESEENKRLASFFANKKVMLDTGNQNPITFLVNGGYLSKPTFNHIKYDASILSEQDIKKLNSATDIPKYILEKLSVNVRRNLKIIHEVLRLYEKHTKIILFASEVKHARDLAIILRAKQCNAHYITSKTPSGIRAKLLHQFKNTDEHMVLCNYGILTTGFDAPKTSAVVIARPTKSAVLYAQMVGRGIRGPKAGGNEISDISTIMDHEINNFIDIEQIFTQWELAWNE